jgi:hypothetical protein
MNGLQTVHGVFPQKQRLVIPSFPTQSLDDITYTIDVAKDAPTLDFDEFQTAFGASAPNHKLINISQYISNENKVSLRYTFSKLPGKLLQGYDVTQDTLGTVGSVTTQQVATGTPPPTGFLITSASNEATDAQVSKQTVNSVTSWPDLTSMEGITTTRMLTQHTSGAVHSTLIERVSPTTQPIVDFGVVEASVVPDQNSSVRSIRSTTRVDNFRKLVSPEVNPEAHGATTITTIRIVPSGKKASGTITLNANPSEGDTVTINDQINPAVVFTFSTTTGVIIGATPSATASALVAVIRAALPLEVLASANGPVVTITSNGAGLEGNAVTLATTSAAITLSGATLTGGTSPAPTPGGVNILKSSIEDADGTHALQTTIALAPGETWPTLTETRWDKQMGVMISETRQRVAPSSITSGFVINYDTSTPPIPISLSVTERKDIDKWAAWKVVTNYPVSPYNSVDSAILEDDWIPMAFPARIIPESISISGMTPTAYEPRAELIPAVSRRWYVIGDKPTVAVDQISLGYTYLQTSLTSFKLFNNVLHDNTTTAASIPSLTDYTDNWIGNEKVRRASVKQLQPGLYECQTLSVVMQ